jgi:hypothetical protein
MNARVMQASHQIHSGGVGCARRSGAFDSSTDEQSRASRGSAANWTSIGLMTLKPPTSSWWLANLSRSSSTQSVGQGIPTQRVGTRGLCWSSGFSLRRLTGVVIGGNSHTVAIAVVPRQERRLKPELQRFRDWGE